MGLLDLPLIRRIRRNHAMEHATIHLLGRRYPGTHLAGRSDHRGYFIYGNVKTEDAGVAAREALRMLKEQPELAVHPRCGTNMVVGGLIAGVLSLVAVSTIPKERQPADALDILPRLVLAGTLAMVASQPLGPIVQRRITTLPDVDGLRVGDIERHQRGRHVLHRILVEEVTPA